MPLQTTRAYQLKKNNNNRKKCSTILKKSAIHSGNKRNPKKKKRGSKNPKTQNVLPDQNSHSLSLQTLLCSFKHIDRP